MDISELFSTAISGSTSGSIVKVIILLLGIISLYMASKWKDEKAKKDSEEEMIKSIRETEADNSKKEENSTNSESDIDKFLE